MLTRGSPRPQFSYSGPLFQNAGTHCFLYQMLERRAFHWQPESPRINHLRQARKHAQQEENANTSRTNAPDVCQDCCNVTHMRVKSRSVILAPNSPTPVGPLHGHAAPDCSSSNTASLMGAGLRRRVKTVSRRATTNRGRTRGTLQVRGLLTDRYACKRLFFFLESITVRLGEQCSI